MYRISVQGRSDSMNREEFVNFVAKNIKYHLPDTFADCQIEEKDMRLIISKSNSSNRLVIYLDKAYEQFMEDRTIFRVMEKIARNINTDWQAAEKVSDEKKQAIKLANNYDEAKKRIQVILRDPDVSDIPSNWVTTQIESYVALYQINLDSNNVSVPITNEMIQYWGITTEQLLLDALEVNEPWNKPVLTNAEDWIFNPNLENLLDLSSEQFEKGFLYILSNETLDNGAAVIVNSKVLEKIGNLLEQDYYLFPSSKQEMMVHPDIGVVSVKEMQEMVQEVNSTRVSPEDVLSNKVLYYDCKERKLELAAVREERLAEMKENQKETSEKLENPSKKKEEKIMNFTPRI